MGTGYGSKMVRWTGLKTNNYICEVCQKSFQSKNNFAKVCPDCRPDRAKKYRKEYEESVKVEGTCIQCGKTFRYIQKKGEIRDFCSSACNARWKRDNKGIYGHCIVCGKPVEEGSYYCSDECRWEKGRNPMNRSIITKLFESGVGDTVSDEEMIQSGFSKEEISLLRQEDCSMFPPLSYYNAFAGGEYLGSSSKFSRKGVPIFWETERCLEMISR